MNHLPQGAGYEGDDLDAAAGDHFLQRSGNRSADQCADLQLPQTKRLLNRQISRQRLLTFPDNPTEFFLDDVNLPGGVKDWRDPIFPARKGCFHLSNFRSSSAHLI